MSLSQFIRDNTNGGHNIARLLIDVMEGRIDNARVSHRLTAARLLTIYGYGDVDDSTSANTPEVSDRKWARRVRLSIGADLTRLIKANTDDGQDVVMFLIDVMEGRVEGINVGHRLSAAKELLGPGVRKEPKQRPPQASGIENTQAVDSQQASGTHHPPRGCRLRGPPGRAESHPHMQLPPRTLIPSKDLHLPPFVLTLSKDLHLPPFILSPSKDLQLSPFILSPSKDLPPFILSLSKDSSIPPTQTGPQSEPTHQPAKPAPVHPVENPLWREPVQARSIPPTQPEANPDFDPNAHHY